MWKKQSTKDYILSGCKLKAVNLSVSGSPHPDRKKLRGLYAGHKEERIPLFSLIMATLLKIVFFTRVNYLKPVIVDRQFHLISTFMMVFRLIMSVHTYVTSDISVRFKMSTPFV